MADTNHLIQTTANVSTTTTALTGTATVSMSFVDWITQYYIVIGATCTVLSLIVALTFHIINYRLAVKAKTSSYELEKASTIAGMRQQGLEESEIKKILKMSGVE